MAILTASDFADLLPTTDEAKLDMAIAQAQAMAEGPMGANRPLDLTVYTELKTVPPSGIVLLSFFPYDAAYTPTLQLRGGSYPSFGRYNESLDWRTVTSDEYEIDTDRAEIRIKTAYWQDANAVGGVRVATGYRLRRPGTPNKRPDLRIQYRAGFDFSGGSTVAAQIKSLVQAIAYLQVSTADTLYPTKSGKSYANPLALSASAPVTLADVDKVDVQDAYSVTYANPSPFVSAVQSDAIRLPDMLKMLQKYRPRPSMGR
jgi:hypothetical protein